MLNMAVQYRPERTQTRSHAGNTKLCGSAHTPHPHTHRHIFWQFHCITLIIMVTWESPGTFFGNIRITGPNAACTSDSHISPRFSSYSLSLYFFLLSSFSLFPCLFLLLCHLKHFPGRTQQPKQEKTPKIHYEPDK